MARGDHLQRHIFCRGCSGGPILGGTNYRMTGVLLYPFNTHHVGIRLTWGKRETCELLWDHRKPPHSHQWVDYFQNCRNSISVIWHLVKYMKMKWTLIDVKHTYTCTQTAKYTSTQHSMWPHYITDHCTVTHYNACRLVQYFIPSATALAPPSLILLLPRL